MFQSFLIKLGMLVMTMGVVFWIGWKIPQPSVKTAGLTADSEIASRSLLASTESKNDVPSRTSGNAAARTPVDSEAPALGVRAARPRLLDLNRANAIDLEALPGIGGVLARRVIDYRKSVGGFRTVEELCEVKGIGLRKFNRIKPLVTVVVSDSKGTSETPQS